MLEQEPATLLKWLQDVQADSIKESSNWWLGIAQSAVQKARQEADREKKLLWARVAVQVYNLEPLLGSSRNSSECSAKMFAVSMIKELGAVTGDPVFDPNLIEDWFFRRLTMSLEEAQEKASNWHTRPIKEILELRELKNRINVIEQLRMIGYLQNNAELSKWLEIKSKLL